MFVSIRLPVLQRKMPRLWSGQRLHILWSELAAAGGSWIMLPWMAAAVPSQTCQLGWHRRSDSWFGTRSGRQRRKCVLCACFYVRCYLSRGPAGVQGWWYGRLAKQEIAGPSRLILPTLPLAWLSAPSCCGHGMAASEARWRARTSVPDRAWCVCFFMMCLFDLSYERREKRWRLWINVFDLISVPDLTAVSKS